MALTCDTSDAVAVEVWWIQSHPLCLHHYVSPHHVGPFCCQLLELARADAEQLFKSVQSTASTADRIGSRVRRLDQQQTNVTETLELINLILDRTHCISGVQQALASHDYDTAAQHIATFLLLEKRLSSAAVAGVDAGQVEEQRQVRGWRSRQTALQQGSKGVWYCKEAGRQAARMTYTQAGRQQGRQQGRQLCSKAGSMDDNQAGGQTGLHVQQGSDAARDASRCSQAARRPAGMPPDSKGNMQQGMQADKPAFDTLCCWWVA